MKSKVSGHHHASWHQRKRGKNKSHNDGYARFHCRHIIDACNVFFARRHMPVSEAEYNTYKGVVA